MIKIQTITGYLERSAQLRNVASLVRANVRFFSHAQFWFLIGRYFRENQPIRDAMLGNFEELNKHRKDR